MSQNVICTNSLISDLKSPSLLLKKVFVHISETFQNSRPSYIHSGTVFLLIAPPYHLIIVKLNRMIAGNI